MRQLSLITIAIGLALTLPMAQAQNLRSNLSELMSGSARLNAARSDEQAAAERVKESSRRAWTPQLDLSADGGRQHYATTANPNPQNQSVNTSSIKLTQLISDFGRSGSQISESEALQRQAAATALATAEGLMLEGITAHWGVVRSRRVLDYARQSEASVLKQTRLENSMVELGKGYESNVLQAKVQLATAEARRIRSEGALEIAQARVRAVFGAQADRVVYQEVALPQPRALPVSLEEAINIANANSKQIQIGAQRTDALRQRLETTKAREFRPRLQVSGELARKDNMDGLPGSVNDRKLMLQLQYTLNTGMAGNAAVEAAVKDLAASQAREDDTREQVREQVAIAWRNLLVARTNRDILANQVNIASKFLEMASAERQLGRRTLLDILTAEMSLINAQSDLATTDADLALAGLTLLQSIGRLDLDNVTFEAAASRP